MPRTLFEEQRVTQSYSSNEFIVLHHGEVLEFLKSLPPGFVSLVVTSPPYNLGKRYEHKKALNIYLAEQAQVIDDLLRVLRDDGSICWQVGNYVENGEVLPLDVFFFKQFHDRGLKLRNRIVWHFGHGLHASRRFSGRYETLLWFTKGDNYVFNLDSVRIAAKYPGKTHFKGPKKGKPSGNPLGKNPSDVWEFIQREWDDGWIEIPNVKANHPEKTVHPCQFPVELVERCVLALTKEGDWVFDPYAGVGSSLVAGIKRARRVIGCEKEKVYVDIARERIERFFAGQLKLRKIGTPIFQPTGREKVARRPREWREANAE